MPLAVGAFGQGGHTVEVTGRCLVVVVAGGAHVDRKDGRGTKRIETTLPVSLYVMLNVRRGICKWCPQLSRPFKQLYKLGDVTSHHVLNACDVVCCRTNILPRP